MKITNTISRNRVFGPGSPEYEERDCDVRLTKLHLRESNSMRLVLKLEVQVKYMSRSPCARHEAIRKSSSTLPLTLNLGSR